MKKKLCTFILFGIIFLCVENLCIFPNDLTKENIHTVSGEDYDKLIEKVFERSPFYKRKLLEFAQSELSNTIYKFRWIPRPLIDSAYAGNFYTANITSQTNALKTGIRVYQSLPAGISFQAQTEQFFGINKKNTDTKSGQRNYGYEFDSSAALSIPFYAAAPTLLPAAVKSELKTHALLSEQAALNVRSIRKSILSETINRINSYLLLKERIVIEEQREILRQKEAVFDNALWETGAVSSFELSERTTKRYEQYLALLQLKENLSAVCDGFYEIGLTEEDMPESIESWLAYLEDFIRKNPTENGLDIDAEEKKLTLYFYNKAEEGLLSLPKINLSVQAAPEAGTGRISETFGSSIRDYWKQAQKWDFSLHISMKLSLFPFEKEYLALKDFSLVRRKYNAELEILNIYRKNRENRYKSKIELLQKLSDKAEREKIDADNRVIAAEALNKQGYLSETSFAYQKLNALLAENNRKEVRLRRISTVLEGY